MNRQPTPQPNRHRRPAFSLLELLIVIGVIALLVSAVLVASPRIIGAQRETQAQGIVLTLDRALDEYHAVRGRFPLYNEDTVDRYAEVFSAAYDGSVPVPNEAPPITEAQRAAGPIFDYQGRDHPLLPDAWMFYDQAEGFGEVTEVLKGIPAGSSNSRAIQSPGPGIPDTLVRFVDPWGLPIIFVHPSNDAAQDLFGRCNNDRPYFLSAGRDEAFGFFKELVGSTTIPAGAEGEVIRRELQDAIDNNITSAPTGRSVPATETRIDNLRQADIPLQGQS